VNVLDNPLVSQALEKVKHLLGPEERRLFGELAAQCTSAEELLRTLEQVAHYDYRWKPVGMEEFILSPHYLGLDGTCGRGKIFPGLVADLVELFEGDYNEAVLYGAIGWGKSTFCEVSIARMLYDMSSLKSPQAIYDLREGGGISVLNVSVNKVQAKKVVFSRVKEMLAVSPFFREEFPHDPKVESELKFRNNLYFTPAAASEGGTIGYDVWGAVMDEVNFMAVVESSTQARGAKYDQATHVSELLMRRIKSRFNRGGSIPGILLHASSSKYPDDFTERKAEQFRVDMEKYEEAQVKIAVGEWPAEQKAPEKPKVFLRRNTNWGVKDPSWFSSERFFLYLGTPTERPFITDDEEKIAPYREHHPELVIEVPMDFRTDFERNLDGSIRDIAGYPTLAIKPFMPQLDKVMDAFERGNGMGMVHPFTREETTLQGDGGAFLKELVKFDPSLCYYAHVDLAIRKDAAGIAVGHVRRWKRIKRQNLQTNVLVEYTLPVIVIDFMLRVRAPVGGEIEPDGIRALLLLLREHGCNLRKVTYDQFQSITSQQAFRRLGIESEHFSVDSDMEGYNALKEAALEDRLLVYSYTPFLDEMSRLEMDEVKGKVDHPPHGSKDVTDAVAAVCAHCANEEVSVLVDPSYGEFEDTQPQIPGHWHNPRIPEDRRKNWNEDDILFAWDDDEPEGSGTYIGFA
jgi:hypothetical protein